MLRVILSKRPSIKELNPRYLKAIHKIFELIDNIENPYHIKVHGVYVRGSSVHGCESVRSDLDVVVVVRSQSLVKIRRFEYTLENLIAMYVFSFKIEIKVYGLDKKNHFVRPAVVVDQQLNSILKRHLNFDLFANGVLVQGQPIQDPTNLFYSPLDFVQNSCVVWLYDLDQLSKRVTTLETHDYYIYQLIKKALKFACLVKFKANVGYISRLPDCLTYCDSHYKFKGLFHFIQNYIGQKSELNLEFIRLLQHFVDEVIAHAKLHFQVFLPNKTVPDCTFDLCSDYQKLFIQNSTQIDLVQEPWSEVIDDIIQQYQNYLSNQIHSIYLRGSVAHGTAIAYESDVDIFVVIKRPLIPEDRQWAEEKRAYFCDKYPFCYDIDLDLIHIDDILPCESELKNSKLSFNHRFYIKTQSICLKGENLETKIPPIPISYHTVKQLLPEIQSIYKIAIEGITNNHSAELKKQWCRWFMKQVLRYFFLTVMPKVGYFTRDLILCYQSAAIFYPNFECQLTQALNLGIQPISDSEALYKAFEELADCIEEIQFA